MTDIAEEYENQTLCAHWTKKVANKSIKKASMSVKDATYNGGSITPSVTVKYGKTTLKKGYDYTITCSNNVNAGNSAKVSIKGMGDYKDTVTRTFKIKKCSMSSVKATIPYGNVVWYGWAQKTGFSLYLQRSKTSKYTLKKGTDYTFNYKNNKEPGKIVVCGRGTATITVYMAATKHYRETTKTIRINIS